ncbi:MAG: thiamine pyrophosphate-binding protein [Burkholderiales bacterium]
MTRRTMNGRTAFLQLLADQGVTHLFGNPGTTELAIMEAVPHFPQVRYVLGLQECVVLGMADGFARASGSLVACNLHCTPGLGHAMGALYSAKFSGSPIIVTAGQYEQGYGLQEPMLYEPLVPIAAPLVKWAIDVPRVQDLPRIVHRAAKIALTPPTGPVFLSLPGDILDDEAELDLGAPTRIERGVRPGDETMRKVARRLLSAKNPVVIAGRELASGDAFNEAAELAELIGAAVYHEPVPYNARFPTDHPTFMGDLTRNQPKVRETLERYDLLICLGADLLRMSPYSPIDPLPDGMPVVHITERAPELGKNYPTALAVCADVRETLRALLPLVREGRDPRYSELAAARTTKLKDSNWSQQRERARDSALSLGSTVPIDPRYLMLCVAEAVSRDTIVVEEAVTAAAPLAALLPVRDARSFYGLASGGLGFALPGAIGVSLARPGQPVLAAVGDGSAMYAIQALWTAAHLRLPITYAVINNRSYRIIKDRLVSLRHSERFVGMDMKEPDIDFVAVAQGLGVTARRIAAPGDLGAVLRNAVESGTPNLVEVMVAEK